MANVLTVPDAYADQIAKLLAVGRQTVPIVVVDDATFRPNWNQVLAVGNQSGTNAVISTGNYLYFAGTPTNGYLTRGTGTLQLVAGNTATSGDNLQLSPGEGSVPANNGVLDLTHAGPTFNSAIQISNDPGGGGHTGGAAVFIDQNGLAFFDGTTVTKPSVTGAKGGNAALTSLLTTLANMGLITDNTT